MKKLEYIKKLIFLIEGMGIGGAERVISVLTKALCDKYDVTIITLKRNEVEYQIDNAITRYSLELPNGYKKFFIGRRTLEKTLIQLKPDVVIAFDILPNILVNAVSPINKRWVTVISERSAPKEAEISLVSKILRNIYYKKADKFVFQTEEAMKYYSKSIQQRACIIPNPIKENLPTRIFRGQHRIVAVARLAKQKNYICLLKAFALFVQIHNDYILEIYGEGEYRQKIEDMIQELQLANCVKLMGKCEEVHYKIRNAQIFIMSSLYEGMPNALMEAMAMGFPVIASDCPSGGPRALIQNKENGYLFKNNDSNDLFNKMCNALEDPKLEEVAKTAKKIQKKYCSQKISAKWEALIEGIENKC